MQANTLLNNLHNILRRSGFEVGRVVPGYHPAFDEAGACVGVVECEVEGEAADVVPEPGVELVICSMSLVNWGIGDETRGREWGQK